MTAPPQPSPSAHATVEALYTHHHDWLQGWLRRQLGSAAQHAADLAHDTFVRLLARPRLIDAARPPRAYLSTIARGLVIDHWRHQAVERAWLDTLAAQPEAFAPSPEEQALVIEALCRISALLDQLAPRPRQAFLLAQIDGLGYAQIGVELGVSERMVKKYMAQAMLHCIAG
ncbi:sigma-70 family RNA polymerase sigma factor [Xylophilus sp. GW821-FHT01B05]